MGTERDRDAELPSYLRPIHNPRQIEKSGNTNQQYFKRGNEMRGKVVAFEGGSGGRKTSPSPPLPWGSEVFSPLAKAPYAQQPIIVSSKPTKGQPESSPKTANIKGKNRIKSPYSSSVATIEILQ